MIKILHIYMGNENTEIITHINNLKLSLSK